MGSMRSSAVHYVLLLLLVIQSSHVNCYQYKVGDLDAWGIPTSANPKVYTNWANNHVFKLGDSLLFLYPPSQDSLIQVTAASYNSCDLKDPILYMNNGNSLFNFTENGDFYFTSGEKGHCEKHQKLHVAVGKSSAPDGPSALPDATAPSYPTVFGSIPMAPSSSLSSSSSSMLKAPLILCAAVMGVLIYSWI